MSGAILNGNYDKTVVRSLDKGLAVIEALNIRDGQSIQEISLATDINRGIVYRLLETLRRRGYISKHEQDHRYWLAPMVQALASGYRNESWIQEIVEPACTELGRKLTWPVNFTTYDRQGMVVRACSDYESPLTVDKIPVGYCIPIYKSSTGRAYLAFCDLPERQKLMDLLFARDAGAQNAIDPNYLGNTLLRQYDRNRERDRSYFNDKNLAAVRAAGYDEITYTPKGLPHRTVVSAAVLGRGRIIGVLSLRFYARALTVHGTLDSYISELLAAAEQIGERVSMHPQATLT